MSSKELLHQVSQGAIRQADAQVLNGDFRMNATSKQTLLSNMAELRRAAVALILFHDDQGCLQLLLIQRARGLKHHPAQVGFPGGRRETNDRDDWATAKRETIEEIGLTLDDSHMISPLAPYGSGSGFWVQPYLCYLPNFVLTSLKLDKDEVDLAFSVPVADLVSPEFSTLGSFFHDGKKRFWAKYDTKPATLWGLSAGIVTCWLEDSGFDLNLTPPDPSPPIQLHSLEMAGVA